MLKSSINSYVSKLFRTELGYRPIQKVCCEIDGKILYLTELEVAALQYMCVQAYKAGNFEDFKANTIVYSGRLKRNSRIMKWLPSGDFEGQFDNGFFENITTLNNLRNSIN